VVAPVLGLGIAARVRTTVGSLAPWLALRPLRSGDLVVARLQALSVGVVLFWLLVFVEAVPFLLLSGRYTSWARPWNSPAGLAVIGVGSLVLAWRMAVEGLCFNQTGRWWLITTGLLLHWIVWGTPLLAIDWLVDHADRWLAWLRQPPPEVAVLASMALVLKL